MSLITVTDVSVVTRDNSESYSHIFTLPSVGFLKKMYFNVIHKRTNILVHLSWQVDLLAGLVKITDLLMCVFCLFNFYNFLCSLDE